MYAGRIYIINNNEMNVQGYSFNVILYRGLMMIRKMPEKTMMMPIVMICIEERSR